MWQVAQIRGLLPLSYCRPHKSDSHPYDSHPSQHGIALFHFALKMAFQYREPNPTSRALAAHLLEKLAACIELWIDGEGPPTTLPPLLLR